MTRVHAESGRAFGQRFQPHLVRDQDLRDQREEFALDGAQDRPFHFLAHARAKRGLPWHQNLGRHGMLTEARRQTLNAYSVLGGLDPNAEAARLSRLYVSEVPFLRTRVADDGERWAQALRRGR